MLGAAWIYCRRELSISQLCSSEGVKGPLLSPTTTWQMWRQTQPSLQKWNPECLVKSPLQPYCLGQNSHLNGSTCHLAKDAKQEPVTNSDTAWKRGRSHPQAHTKVCREVKSLQSAALTRGKGNVCYPSLKLIPFPASLSMPAVPGLEVPWSMTTCSTWLGIWMT